MSLQAFVLVRKRHLYLRNRTIIIQNNRQNVRKKYKNTQKYEQKLTLTFLAELIPGSVTMGNYLGRSKEEWSEVYNNGSPGSPDR